MIFALEVFSHVRQFVICCVLVFRRETNISKDNFRRKIEIVNLRASLLKSKLMGLRNVVKKREFQKIITCLSIWNKM